MHITYKAMVDDVLSNLAGYTMRQDRMTHLTSSITSTSLTLNLGSVSNIGKGVVEIDDELIWIDSYDRISNTATVAPYGRGFAGTTAAAHDANAKVTVAPTFPRYMVKKTINEAIQAVYPNLFALGTTSFAYNSIRNTYEIPAEVSTVQYVSWQTVGPSKEWKPIKGWRHDSYASHDEWTTNNTLTIYDPIPAGRTIFVHYTKVPEAFDGAAETATFEETTGLQASARDVVIYGACYRLASFIDSGRLNYSSAEADTADSKIQYGSGASTARYFLNLYQLRLKEEMNKLRDLYPTRVHFTRY